MSPALTILLITIAAGGGDSGGAMDDPFTPGVARATREALGPDTQIVLKELETAPDEAEAVELGARAHADAIVEVEWSLPDHLRTTIRLQRLGSKRWLDRDVGFREVDEPGERSRTVGFAIASMLPEYAARAQASQPSATAAPVAAPEPSKPAARAGSSPSKRRESSTDEAATEGHPGATGEASATAGPPEPRIRHANSASLSGIAALAIGDRGGGFGGVLDYRRELGPTLSLRVGVSGRISLDSPTEVSARFVNGAAGVAWNAWSSNNGRGLVGLRLDALMVVAQFEYRSPERVTTQKQKFLPGSDLCVEAGYFFTRGVSVVAAAGAEAVFGQTTVFVGDRRATSLRPVHPLLELGIRAGF